MYWNIAISQHNFTKYDRCIPEQRKTRVQASLELLSGNIWRILLFLIWVEKFCYKDFLSKSYLAGGAQ